MPSGFGNFIEMVVEGLHGLAQSVAGKWTATFFPIVMTIFLIVIVSNWFGLLPGVGTIGWLEHPHSTEIHGYVANGIVMTAEPAPHGDEGVILVPFFRAPSTDLNFTLALALIAVVLSQYFGVKAQKLGYFKKFFDFSGFKQGALMGVIMVFVGLLELIAEFARIISFSFRLFGNIFAGEVLLLVMAFLIPYIVSLPFYGLETVRRLHPGVGVHDAGARLLHPGHARARRRSASRRGAPLRWQMADSRWQSGYVARDGNSQFAVCSRT